jgi:DNA-binding transcriptional LysR family regulator
MDRLAAIAGFVQVVERRSFSAAGQHLGVTASTVSKHVSQLEQWLGVRLLLRTTRHVNVTEAGGAFYERCRRIMSEVQHAEATAREGEDSPKGLLRVNAPHTFGLLHIAPLIPELAARYPQISVDLHLDDRVVDAVRGAFDVTIRVAPLLRDSSFIVRKLALARVVVCAAPAYLERRGVPRLPHELVQHACLASNHLSTPNTWHFGAHGEISVLVSGPLRANNGEALRDAAIAGLGLVQLPTFIVGRALNEGTLCTVLDDFEGPAGAVCALYQAGRTPAKVRVFADLLAEHLGPARTAEPIRLTRVSAK